MRRCYVCGGEYVGHRTCSDPACWRNGRRQRDLRAEGLLPYERRTGTSGHASSAIAADGRRAREQSYPEQARVSTCVGDHGGRSRPGDAAGPGAAAHGGSELNEARAGPPQPLWRAGAWAAPIGGLLTPGPTTSGATADVAVLQSMASAVPAAVVLSAPEADALRSVANRVVAQPAPQEQYRRPAEPPVAGGVDANGDPLGGFIGEVALPLCLVCWVWQRSVVLAPCGHCCIWQECPDGRLRSGHGGIVRCPRCRGEAWNSARLYF